MNSQYHSPTVNNSGSPSDNDPAQENRPHKILRIFDRFASHVTVWAGSAAAFSMAFALVLLWASTGPLFHYSETWQLVINTGTTIVTFLMVFLIQRSQNKDCQAVHLKLDELLRSIEDARNEMIDAEDLSSEELERLGNQFRTHRTKAE